MGESSEALEEVEGDAMGVRTLAGGGLLIDLGPGRAGADLAKAELEPEDEGGADVGELAEVGEGLERNVGRVDLGEIGRESLTLRKSSARRLHADTRPANGLAGP